MHAEVIRSAKRRKTVSARLVDGVVQVSIPARMTKTDEATWVREMVGRFERKQAAAPIDLAARAELLAVRHGLPQPASIRWVDNQEWRWGSCTPADRSIRLSTRLAGFPDWVVDYVVVHELAHLVVAGHGRDFWSLVERYPRTERARGFLLAMGMADADGPNGPSGPAAVDALDVGDATGTPVAVEAVRPVRPRRPDPAPDELRSPRGGGQRTLW